MTSSSYGRSLKEDSRPASSLQELPPQITTAAATSSTVTVTEAEDLDVQSIINERRPSKLKPVSAFSPYSHLYVKEETAAEAAEQQPSQDEQVKEVASASAADIAGPPSSVELRIFVDETPSVDDGQLEETQDSDLVVLVESNKETTNGKKKKKSTNGTKDETDT